MSRGPSQPIDPLLRPLSDDQRFLLEVIAASAAQREAWPIRQYVEAQLDDRGLDLDAVLASLPFLTDHVQLTYSLVRRNRSGIADGDPLKLTVAGLAHLEQFAGTIQMFLQVLAEIAERRAAAVYDPQHVVYVDVSGPELIKTLHLDEAPLVALLPDLLGGEPATWHGANRVNAEGWAHQPSSFIRRFRGVRTVDEYVDRLRSWLSPQAPQPVPMLASPLSLAATFDYLDVVWRLRFSAPLVHLPGAERTTRLAFEAATAEEFDNRLSALGELLKGLDVPGEKKHGPLQRLSTFLPGELPAEAMPRVEQVVATLQTVTRIRNAGQHVDASSKAVIALGDLGIAFPIADYATAWRTIQAHVVEALAVLREEIHATI